MCLPKVHPFLLHKRQQASRASQESAQQVENLLRKHDERRGISLPTGAPRNCSSGRRGGYKYPDHAGRTVVSELRLLSREDYLVRAALDSFGGSRRASLFIYATEQVSTFPKICILLKLAGCPLSSVVLLFFLRMPHNSLAPFLPLFRYISNRVCVLSECQLVLTDFRAHVVPALIHEKRFPFYQQWSLY